MLAALRRVVREPERFRERVERVELFFARRFFLRRVAEEAEDLP